MYLSADQAVLPACLLTCAGPAFDLVVSGINRGDNCGLHVIYSGTVGAAREAACKVGSHPGSSLSSAAHVVLASYLGCLCS
jgi:5'/3'-nucleotidase SurE